MTPPPITPPPTSTDQARESGAGSAPGRAAGVGTVAGLVGALPVLGPALVAGCLSCVGVGTAAGLGVTGALPPTWWLAGLAVTAAGALLADRRRARHCRRPARPGATLAVLLVVAAGSWLATRYTLVPLVEWATGLGQGSSAPTLP